MGKLFKPSVTTYAPFIKSGLLESGTGRVIKYLTLLEVEGCLATYCSTQLHIYQLKCVKSSPPQPYFIFHTHVALSRTVNHVSGHWWHHDVHCLCHRHCPPALWGLIVSAVQPPQTGTSRYLWLCCVCVCVCSCTWERKIHPETDTTQQSPPFSHLHIQWRVLK